MADKIKYIDSVQLQYLLGKLRDKNVELFLGKHAVADEAVKVSKNLTLTVGDSDIVFDGSTAQSATVAAKSHIHTHADISDFAGAVKKAAFGSEDASMTAHTHDNLTVLDKLSDDKLTAWDAKISVDDIEKIKYTNAGVGGATNVKNALDILVKNVQINLAALGDATANVNGLASRITAAEKDVDAVEGRATALEAAVGDDKAGLVKDVADLKTATGEGGAVTAAIADAKKAGTDAAAAVGAEEGRATKAETGLSTRIKVIEDDYLKEADKTALAGQISAEQTRAEGKEAEIKKVADANAAAIVKLNGADTVVGSVANAVLVEKNRALAAEQKAQQQADANKDAIAILNGDGEGSVDKKITDKIAEVNTATGNLASRVEANETAIGKSTDAKAADGSLYARIAQNVADIDAIEADYLKAADKTALQNAINTEKGRMDTFLASANLKEGAIDTLKEIQDYIATHGAAADEMVKNIGANKTAIDAINNTETGILKTAKDYADTQDGTLHTTITGEIATAKSEAIADAASKDEALHTAISKEIDGDVKIVSDALAEEVKTARAAEKANKDAITKLNGNAQTEGSVDYKIAQSNKTAEGVTNALDSRITAAEGDIDTLQATVNKLNGAVDAEGSIKKQIADARADLVAADAQVLKDAKQYASDEDAKINAVIGVKAAGEQAATGLCKDIADNVAAIAAEKKRAMAAEEANKNAIESNDADITDLQNRMDTAESDITTHSNNIKALQEYVNNHVTATQQDIDAILTAVYGA